MSNTGVHFCCNKICMISALFQELYICIVLEHFFVMGKSKRLIAKKIMNLEGIPSTN